MFPHQQQKGSHMTTRTAVWIDHREARIFHVSADAFDEKTVATPQHSHRKHPKGESNAQEHPDDAKRFFHEIARSLAASSHILLVGPSTAKLELLRYLHTHEHAIEACVVGIETVDHPTDRQLAAYARTYFKLGES
jgi:stalled ribosome rescue protein Dom34